VKLASIPIALATIIAVAIGRTSGTALAATTTTAAGTVVATFAAIPTAASAIFPAPGVAETAGLAAAFTRTSVPRTTAAESAFATETSLAGASFTRPSFTGATVEIDLEVETSQGRVRSEFNGARRFGLGDFDEAEIREELDAPDRAALEVAFVVEHADDVAGIDALVLADAEEELHHAGLGAFAGLGAGLAFEIALAASARGVAGLPGGAALGVVATFGALWAIFPGTAFAAVVRSRLAVFRDLFTLASVGVAK
jgi:hypothetical protein